MIIKFLSSCFRIPPGFTTRSANWVGAWWVGFVVSSAVMFLIAIPILGYPRTLPSRRKRGNPHVNIQGQYTKYKKKRTVGTDNTIYPPESLEDEASCQLGM